jgi:hypothetical protein
MDALAHRQHHAPVRVLPHYVAASFMFSSFLRGLELRI